MKTNQQCIKCGYKRLWIIDKVMQPTETAATRPLHATAWTFGFNNVADGMGHFQAFICARCGYTELYAQNLDGLRGLATSKETGVRLVDNEPDNSGPYR